MTAAPSHTVAAAADMPAAIAALRAGGLRVSSARRVVLAALLAADGPVTADQLASGLGGLTTPSDLASMYRNLDTFVQLGVVRQVQLGSGAARFVLSARCEGGYATCARCQTLEPLPPSTRDALCREVMAASGFRAGFAALTVIGLCAHCQDPPPLM